MDSSNHLLFMILRKANDSRLMSEKPADAKSKLTVFWYLDHKDCIGASVTETSAIEHLSSCQRIHPLELHCFSDGTAFE